MMSQPLFSRINRPLTMQMHKFSEFNLYDQNCFVTKVKSGGCMCRESPPTTVACYKKFNSINISCNIAASYLMQNPSLATRATVWFHNRCNIRQYKCDRQNSQMAYHPKREGEMADFETFTLCNSSDPSQMSTYFWKDLVTGSRLYMVKIRFPTVIYFLIDFITHTLLMWA